MLLLATLLALQPAAPLEGASAARVALARDSSDERAGLAVIPFFSGGAGALLGLGAGVSLGAGASAALGELGAPGIIVGAVGATILTPLGAGLGAALAEGGGGGGQWSAAFLSAAAGSGAGGLALGAAGAGLGVLSRASTNDVFGLLPVVLGVAGAGVGAVIGGAIGAGLHAKCDPDSSWATRNSRSPRWNEEWE